jgi:predicted RNA-binding protein with PIN domain
VHVVFDAHPVEEMQPPRSGVREVVRCSFSPVGEDADEVLVDLVDATEAVRAVIVATDDQRVRGEVRARGANVVSVTQLLGLLGRRPRV